MSSPVLKGCYQGITHIMDVVRRHTRMCWKIDPMSGEPIGIREVYVPAFTVSILRLSVNRGEEGPSFHSTPG
jgi:hypothetical protein